MHFELLGKKKKARAVIPSGNASKLFDWCKFWRSRVTLLDLGLDPERATISCFSPVSFYDRQPVQLEPSSGSQNRAMICMSGAASPSAPSLCYEDS